MNRYTLSIGSNAPDKAARMAAAKQWLADAFTDVVCSEIYTSAPISGIGPDYANMVAQVSADADTPRMIELGKEYERSCGRTPQSKVLGSVPIDVDVVICNGEIVRPAEYARPYFRRGYDSLSALL